ncbi:MAG: nuclear transport factor 2 family protein [Vicinamibacterales bacterium]
MDIASMTSLPPARAVARHGWRRIVRLVAASIAAATLMLSGACASDALTPERRAEIQSAIARQMQRFAEGAAQRDASVQASIMAKDVVLFDFASEYDGVDAFVDATGKLLASLQSFEMRWEKLEVVVLGPEGAAVGGRAVARRQHQDGRVQESAPYIYFTGVFQLIGGEWKLTRGHLSGFMRAVPSPPAP